MVLKLGVGFRGLILENNNKFYGLMDSQWMWEVLSLSHIHCRSADPKLLNLIDFSLFPKCTKLSHTPYDVFQLCSWFSATISQPSHIANQGKNLLSKWGTLTIVDTQNIHVKLQTLNHSDFPVVDSSKRCKSHNTHIWHLKVFQSNHEQFVESVNKWNCETNVSEDDDTQKPSKNSSHVLMAEN